MEMTKEAVETWVGRSDEVAVPMLGGEFWADGKEISGVFESVREQKIGGFAYKLTLDAAGVCGWWCAWGRVDSTLPWCLKAVPPCVGERGCVVGDECCGEVL